MKQVYDEVRRQWVAATPEEIVRQLWLQKMIQELGYPLSRIAVEKELDSLPGALAPLKRRADIVCYSKEFKPLLLIECKAGKIEESAIEQAVGYNGSLQAPYVAVVNRDTIFFRYNLKCPRCVLFRLPAYAELMKEVV